MRYRYSHTSIANIHIHTQTHTFLAMSPVISIYMCEKQCECAPRSHRCRCPSSLQLCKVLFQSNIEQIYYAMCNKTSYVTCTQKKRLKNKPQCDFLMTQMHFDQTMSLLEDARRFIYWTFLFWCLMFEFRITKKKQLLQLALDGWVFVHCSRPWTGWWRRLCETHIHVQIHESLVVELDVGIWGFCLDHTEISRR